MTTPPRLIGMLHLPPLPGSPQYGGNLTAVRDFALRDAEALSAGGADALNVTGTGTGKITNL
jgi:predicted TIM-barrel enzyme